MKTLTTIELLRSFRSIENAIENSCHQDWVTWRFEKLLNDVKMAHKAAGIKTYFTTAEGEIIYFAKFGTSTRVCRLDFTERLPVSSLAATCAVRQGRRVFSIGTYRWTPEQLRYAGVTFTYAIF